MCALRSASLGDLFIVSTGSSLRHSWRITHARPHDGYESPMDRDVASPPRRPQRGRTLAIRCRPGRFARVSRRNERQEPERARAETAGDCVFRRNMGLFPFATRFARASQLAFVAGPPTNTIRSSSSLVLGLCAPYISALFFRCPCCH